MRLIDLEFEGYDYGCYIMPSIERAFEVYNWRHSIPKSSILVSSRAVYAKFASDDDRILFKMRWL